MTNLNLRHPTIVLGNEWLRVLKLWHAAYGLFLWEFFTTLDYEWKVFRGHIPYRWTIWVYSSARVSALVGGIICIIELDIDAAVNCQIWTSFLIVFTYLSLAAASLLIALRTTAIWNRNKVVMAIAIILWGVNVAFLIEGAARLRSEREPAPVGCVIVNDQSSLATLISLATTDIILLLIMLVGLFRIRRGDNGAFGLANLLWNHGVIWIFLATVVEIPPAVLLALNMNYSFNLMFQVPNGIIMVVAATRMHRSLVDFAYRNTMHDDIQTIGVKLAKTKQRSTTLILDDLVEISAHTISSINAEEDTQMKPSVLSLGKDVERGE